MASSLSTTCASNDNTAPKQLKRTEDDSGNLVEYRRARDIPFELREHCAICFEEGLYSQAISLLQSLLLAESLSTTVSSALVSTKEPLIRPPSTHLALAATLVVHPSVTTRASSAEQLAASDAALRLLHATNDVLGPVNARFGAAFSFTAAGHASRGSSRRRHQYGYDGSGSTPHSPVGSDDLDFGHQQGDGTGGVRSSSALDMPLATTSSLFARADDFWHMVGWAFNCSVRHPMRWQRWKLLLGFLLDSIEDDLAVRTAAASDTNNRSAKAQMEEDERTNDTQAGQNTVPLLTDSLLLRYCSNAEGRTGRRRVMRAILADGSDRSMREFREVFLKETAEKKKEHEEDREKEKHKEGKRELNFDEGLYGDYDSSEDELSIEKQPARSTRKTNSQALESAAAAHSTEIYDNAENEEKQDKNIPKTAANEFGGMESVLLRQRFLLLLSYLSAALPTTFTTLPDLFALYTEFLRPLPLRHFTLFLQSSLLLPLTFRNCLLQMLIRPLIAAATPRDEIPEPTAAEIEKYFLQHAAASVSVADNAKVSIIQEGLVDGLIRGRKKMMEEMGNYDKNHGDDENESGHSRESRPKSGPNSRRNGTGNSVSNSSRSRSASRTRRRSELLRRSEDICNNNNNNNNNSSNDKQITSHHRKNFPSSPSSTAPMSTTKESFLSAVREGIRKRAEKARKKNTASSTAANAGGGGGGGGGSGNNSASGTTARSTKKMENEDDREILEMSAERLLLMAEAVVVVV